MSRRGAANPSWTGGKLCLVCSHCGQAFKAWRRAGGRIARFCSYPCAAKARRQVGSNSRPMRHVRDTSVYESRHIVEQVLERQLPSTVEVHHVDANRTNNAHTNLVACQDRAYHRLLHRRTIVVRAGGNPNTQRFCSQCHTLYPIDTKCRKFRSADGKRRVCHRVNPIA